MADYWTEGFAVETPSWHRKETLLAKAPENIDEARRLAGHAWEPYEATLFARVPVDGEEKIAQLPDQKGIYRPDTGTMLGVVSSDWQVVTNETLWELAQVFLKSTVTARLDVGGTLKDGAQVFICMYLDEPETPKGDISPFLPYWTLLNGHDGSAALKSINTNVRVVCANTWKAAEIEARRRGTEFTFRHTKSIHDNVDEAKRIIASAHEEAAAYKQFAEHYLGVRWDDEKTRQFLDIFVPMPPGELISDTVAGNVHEARAQIKSILASPTCADIQHTAFGIIQAAGQFLDHKRKWKSRDSYVSRQLIKAESGKSKAIKIVNDLVAV